MSVDEHNTIPSTYIKAPVAEFMLAMGTEHVSFKENELPNTFLNHASVELYNRDKDQGYLLD